MNTQIIQLLESSHLKPIPMRMLVLEQMMVKQKNKILGYLCGKEN
jgi:hypothetical protein